MRFAVVLLAGGRQPCLNSQESLPVLVLRLALPLRQDYLEHRGSGLLRRAVRKHLKTTYNGNRTTEAGNEEAACRSRRMCGKETKAKGKA